MQLLFAELAWILAFVAKAFLHILPYLALSLPLAVYLKRAGLAKKIEGTLKGKEAVAVLVATLVGALSPFCSCGVIPIIAALLTGGAPLAPVMAFWLASPSMDPEIFFLSVGSLGWELAVWRLVATFAMSLGAGYATLALERSGFLGTDILRGSAKAGKERRATASPLRLFAPLGARLAALGARPAVACCGASAPAPRAAMEFRPVAPASLGRGAAAPWERACGCGAAAAAPEPACGCGRAIEALSAQASASGGSAASSCGCQSKGREGGFAGMASDVLGIGKRILLFMGLAYLIQALITRYLPEGFVSGLLGKESPFAIPLATLVGVPFYTTGISALGLAAGFLGKGMSEPAVLAFLVGGAVTTLPAMSAVYGIVRPRVFGLYLGFCAAGALLAGYAMQLAQLLF